MISGRKIVLKVPPDTERVSNWEIELIKYVLCFGYQKKTVMLSIGDRDISWHDKLIVSGKKATVLRQRRFRYLVNARSFAGAFFTRLEKLFLRSFAVNCLDNTEINRFKTTRFLYYSRLKPDPVSSVCGKTHKAFKNVF